MLDATCIPSSILPVRVSTTGAPLLPKVVIVPLTTHEWGATRTDDDDDVPPPPRPIASTMEPVDETMRASRHSKEDRLASHCTLPTPFATDAVDDNCDECEGPLV